MYIVVQQCGLDTAKYKRYFVGSMCVSLVEFSVDLHNVKTL